MPGTRVRRSSGTSKSLVPTSTSFVLEENVDGRDKPDHDKFLSSQLIRKFSQIFSRRIDGHHRLCFAGARAVLVRASDMARSQPAGGSGGKIAAVRRHHHAL